MNDKTKQRRLCERVITVWLLIILALIWLLMVKVAVTAERYQASAVNEISTFMIRTTDPSIETDTMSDTVQNEAWVYNHTHATERHYTAAVTNDKATIGETANIQSGQEHGWRHYLTEDEIRLIALIAEKEDIQAMTEIAEVVLNRILSDEFPDSVTEVIYQRNQFYAIKHITDDMMPCDEAIEAVTAVFRDGVSTVGEAIFFAEQSIPPNKIAKGLYLIQSAGDTNFWGQEDK